MNQSETVGELAQALCKVQKEIRGYKEDSSNPFFKSKYGDLTSVWAAVREPLTKNGLAVIQTMGDTNNGAVRVHTTLVHTSGEWIRGTLRLTPDKPGPQAAGSAITYARRYSLAAIVGIAPEDDDAEGSTVHEQPTQQHTRQEKQKAAQTKADNNGFRHNPDYTGGDDSIVTIPAKFKVKPNSGKSLIYIIGGEDTIFPIGHVAGQTGDSVTVTEWIAEQKIKDGLLDAALVGPVTNPNSEPSGEEDVPY